MSHPSLGQRLRELRQRRGLSQTELARQLAKVSGNPAITRHDISRYERDVRRPTWWLPHLATVLNVPIAALQLDHKPAPVLGSDVDAFDLLQRAAASDLGAATLDYLETTVDDHAVAYHSTAPADLLVSIRRQLAVVRDLLGARMTLDEHRRLLVVAGWLSLLSATCHIDLHQFTAARSHLRAAEQLARQTEHGELSAWCLETHAWQAITTGDYKNAVDLSQQAQGVAPTGSSAYIQATAQEGRAWARLGAATETRRVLLRVDALVTPLLVPERPEHHYRYDPTKAESYLATTLAWVGDTSAESYARHILSRLESSTETPRPRRAVAARLDLALALLAANKPDEAGETVLVAITSGSLVPSHHWRAAEIIARIRQQGLPIANNLRDAYQEFCPKSSVEGT